MGDTDEQKFKSEMVAAFQQQSAKIDELQRKLQEQTTSLTASTTGTGIRMEAGKPSVFNGRGQTPIDRWLYQVERYFSLINIAEVKKVPLATSFLEESALDWWRSFEEQTTDAVTWTQLDPIQGTGLQAI